MAFGTPQLSDKNYPTIMQLAQYSRRWLLLLHCFKLMEKSLWWSASLLMASVVIHHSIIPLDSSIIFTLAMAPLTIALFIGLVTGKMNLTNVASRCDQWLNSKQLYTTAVEYLLADANKQGRLATNYVLAQAETLSRQWLPKVKQIQQWKPSPWLVIPLGLSIAALFFHTLPGKQNSPFNSDNDHAEAQLTQQTAAIPTAKEDLAARLETAFKQFNQQQLQANKNKEPHSPQKDENDTGTANNSTDQPASMNTSQQQFESAQDKSDTTQSVQSTIAQSSSSSGNSTQTGASNADANASEQPPQALIDPELDIAYYELEANKLSGNNKTASGRVQELSSSIIAATVTRAASATNLELSNASLYNLQTSPRQRQYLNNYFNKLKAEE